MIYIIVAINLLITLLNIYIALRIWQLRAIVAKITRILINYEHYFNIVLPFAPVVIVQGQDRIMQARQEYQLLQLRVSKIRQLIWLLNWSYRTWVRQ